MHHHIFAAIWLAWAVFMLFARKQGEPVSPWLYTAIVCSTIWSATA